MHTGGIEAVDDMAEIECFQGQTRIGSCKPITDNSGPVPERPLVRSGIHPCSRQLLTDNTNFVLCLKVANPL